MALADGNRRGPSLPEDARRANPNHAPAQLVLAKGDATDHFQRTGSGTIWPGLAPAQAADSVVRSAYRFCRSEASTRVSSTKAGSITIPERVGPKGTYPPARCSCKVKRAWMRRNKVGRSNDGLSHCRAEGKGS